MIEQRWKLVEGEPQIKEWGVQPPEIPPGSVLVRQKDGTVKYCVLQYRQDLSYLAEQTEKIWSDWIDVPGVDEDE